MTAAAGVRVHASALHAFLTRVYATLGLAPDDAAIAAEQAVDAELRGVVSHGCVRVGTFVERLRRGTINPRPRAQTLVDLPGWFLLDGDRGMAAPLGRRAMDLAMAKAQANGIGDHYRKMVNAFAEGVARSPNPGANVIAGTRA